MRGTPGLVYGAHTLRLTPPVPFEKEDAAWGPGKDPRRGGGGTKSLPRSRGPINVG